MASRTTPTFATNLPAEVTSFVGRRQEASDVRKLLGSGRLVTLTGPGGVGKTRLALRAAAGAGQSFDDGVWLVELAPLRTGDEVVHAVADVLGLRDRHGVPLLELLAEYLAERSLLLVLDNCEHLIEEAAALVYRLLRRCPGLHVLATTREPFGLTGEHVLDVPTLPVPHLSGAPRPEALLRYDSVNLFVQRATAGSPGFELTEGNSPDVMAICTALEGIPLAIELAAVRVRSLPLNVIVDRLKGREPASARGAHREPSHHRTLRASVEWSHELCTPEERTLWARLSVFAGGFDLAAAEAVCGAGQSPGAVTDSVATLVDKSIVVREHSAHGDRYRILEILREFGQERLEADPEESTRVAARHRDWFVALAERSAQHWLTSEQSAELSRLREEYGNLRAAYSRSLVNPEDVCYGLRIASALEYYWTVRGWQSEGRQWLDEALAAALPGCPEVARALRVNAFLAALQGDTDAAARMTAQARDIAGMSDDRVELNFITTVDGVIALCTGDVDSARVHLESALKGFEAQGHARGQANALMTLVAMAAAQEDLALAESCHRRCMEFTEPSREAYTRGFSLWARGLAALRAGDLDTAVGLERESLQLKRSIEDQLGEVLCIEALAWIDVARGDDERAALLLGGGERLWSPMRMSMGAILDFGRFRAEYDEMLLRRLGSRRLEAALGRGRAMTVARVLALALGEEERSPAHDSPLTPREQEIAGLVAQGSTNREIASDLVVSQRTVEGHVEKVMMKLGFTRRTQIAAWVAERRAEQVPGRPGSEDPADSCRRG